MTKKEFLTSEKPLTLYCFVDVEAGTSEHKIVHPDFERETQEAMLAQRPNLVYLYIRNKTARELKDSYGHSLYNLN
jgi:hypothetical protein